MNASIRTLPYWCRVNLSLKEVAQLLKEPFELSQCEHNYENVFEWFEAKDGGGRLWNVSRKHDGDSQSSFKDYLIISRKPVSKNTDEIGQKLSDTLNCPVSFGEGIYDKKDTWKFAAQKSYTPNT